MGHVVTRVTRRRAHGTGLVICTVVLVVGLVAAVSPPVRAQEPDVPGAEPTVVFEDVVIERTVVPLGAPGVADMSITVGCDATELAQTITRVVLEPGEVPDHVNVVIAPGELTWTTEPGACPSATGNGTTRAFQASIALDRPGTTQFVPITVPIVATVHKEPPVDGAPANEYGPYTANVTVTPGYFNLYNVRADEKIAQVRVGETANFTVLVENFSNGETRFGFARSEEDTPPPGLTVRVTPETLTLAPDEEGSVLVQAETSATGRFTNDVANFQIDVTSVSTHPDGGPGQSSQVSFLVRFRGDAIDDPSSLLPGPSVGLVVALLALAAYRVGDGRSG